MASSLAEFAILDELIQLVYLGPSRFVLISTLEDAQKHWIISVGLAGAQGRWWRGCWAVEDVRGIAGTALSDEELESFADNIKSTILQGQLYIDGWSLGLQRGEGELHAVFGPTSKKPLRMKLEELSPEEAASRATALFISIGQQAQSRQCELYPANYNGGASAPAAGLVAAAPTRSAPAAPTRPAPTAPTRPAPTAPTRPAPTAPADPPPSVEYSQATRPLAADAILRVAPPTPKKPVASGSSRAQPVDRAFAAEQEEIQSLRAQLAAAQTTPAPPPSSSRAQPVPKSVNSVAARRPPKGASLANPNKKARKYQEIEFEDD